MRKAILSLLLIPGVIGAAQQAPVSLDDIKIEVPSVTVPRNDAAAATVSPLHQRANSQERYELARGPQLYCALFACAGTVVCIVLASLGYFGHAAT